MFEIYADIGSKSVEVLQIGLICSNFNLLSDITSLSVLNWTAMSEF
jgi:hypothetical protein